MIALQWQDRVLSLLDQAAYPQEENWINCSTLQEAVETLSSGKIIDEKVAAVAGAYAYCLAALEHQEELLTPAFDQALNEAKQMLLNARPGSHQMADAITFMENPPENYTKNADRLTALLATAVTFDRKQVITSRNICSNGCDLISKDTRILIRTDSGRFHGAAPTGVFGIVRRAWKRELLERLTICEGRPSLGGSAVAKELIEKENVSCTVIPDHAAATLLALQGAHLAMTDAIRVSANGDVMAPVGSYELAISCYFHSIPFYAVLPISDIATDVADGSLFGRQDGNAQPVADGTNCSQAEAWSPAYDLIPSFLVTGMITDRGIACAPYDETLKDLIENVPPQNIVYFN